MLPGSVSLLGPVAVILTVVVSFSGPGPTAAPDADPFEVSSLSESTIPLLLFPLPVAGLR